MFALLFLLSTALSDTFRSTDVVLETFKGTAFVGMAAAAEFFVVIGGGIDLSIGSVATLSGMAAAVIMGGRNGNILVAILASLGIGLVAGTINGLLVNWLRISPFVATFGMLYILQGIAYTYSSNPIGQAAPGFYAIYVSTVAGVPVLLLTMGVFWALCWYVARQTALGKHLYAVGGDREAARLAGVRTSQVSFASYVICSVIAAAAGLLELTQSYVGSPDLGATLLLTTITAVVIGGVSLFGGEGSVIGVLGGALVLGFLSEFFVSVQVDAFYQELIEGLIIVALLGVYRQRLKT
ncbi:ABC transporter permease [bacterium]|nr:MAG: ABC transporter permease [bacterium]